MHTQKLPFQLNRKGWLVGWLVGWLQEPCQLFTFLHLFTITTCISFPKIYIPILPQSGIIVKRNFFRGFGRIFGCDCLLLFVCRILQNFLRYISHYIPYILFHVMILLIYRICINRAGAQARKWRKNMTKYKFSNKLMFALVMQDEEICAEFIQRLFPGKKVKSITFPNDIKITIVTGVLSKSVRLDVLKIYSCN